MCFFTYEVLRSLLYLVSLKEEVFPDFSSDYSGVVGLHHSGWLMYLKIWIGEKVVNFGDEVCKSCNVWGCGVKVMRRCTARCNL